MNSRIYGPNKPSGRGEDSVTRDLLKRIHVELKAGETSTVDVISKDAETSSPAKADAKPAPKKSQLTNPAASGKSLTARTPATGSRGRRPMHRLPPPRPKRISSSSAA